MTLNSAKTRLVCAALLLQCAGAFVLPAQTFNVKSLVQLGSETEERTRLAQLVDSTNSANFSARSASTLSRSKKSANGYGLTLLAPEITRISNSGLPYSMNDGALWAGRGTNAMYTAGLEMHFGRVRLIASPVVTTAQNLEFQVIPFSQQELNARNVWANPFHPAESSIDLPFRFGENRISRVDAGESSITFDLHKIELGVATEEMWWGPGVQNAILLSNNAPGFLHAFVRTRDGFNGRFGRVDGQWILGRLNESGFFDADSTNDVRSLSGLILEWTPHPQGGLHVGAARAVFAPGVNRQVSFARAFDVLRSVGNPNTSSEDIAKGAGPDQITSVYVRYVLPAAHIESYGEWARFEQPKSLGDFLEFPAHSMAYTLGLQWARPFAHARIFRLAAEATYLEPDASIRLRPVATTYTSRSVVQGYTNRGQSLGAAIGPGSSSQWLSADVFGSSFRVGAYLSRIRWDNATLWLSIVPQVKNEDVTVLAGTKASVTWKQMRLQLDYASAVRLDYLYQDKIKDQLTGSHAGVDISNRTLSLTLSTAVGR